MGTIRNSINIEGLSSEEDLPSEINGQLIRYSEVETLFIPKDKPEAKNIYEVNIHLEINNDRLIKCPNGNIVVLDGIKNYRIVYTENTNNQTACITNIVVPYNTFIELPLENEDILDIKVFIIDAYFYLLDNRRIYGHFVYIIDVHYDYKKVRKYSNKAVKIESEKALLDDELDIEDFSLDIENYDEISASSDSIPKEVETKLFDIDEEIL